MTESTFQVVRGAGFIAAVSAAVLVQRIAPFVGARSSWRTNATLWTVNAVLIGGVCGACACATAQWASAHGIGLLNAAATAPLLAIPITIASLDFVAYAWHRANHRVSVLWRFHAVHHSDLTFTSSTALRFHPGELLLSLPLRLALIVLLGPPVLAILIFEIVFTVANLVEHGDIRLPNPVDRALSTVIVTPSLHRQHHWRAPADSATNFGTITTLWDRVLAPTTLVTPALLCRPAFPASTATSIRCERLPYPFAAAHSAARFVGLLSPGSGPS